MQLIAARNLLDYAAQQPRAAASLKVWIKIVRSARWTTMQDVLATFPSAKALNGERVRFAIRGGEYRLIVAIYFPDRLVLVKFIGTHAEYDAVDALAVDQF